jgi:hypothetical protein
MEQGLINESNLYNFKGLHYKDLNPTGNASTKEILENVNELAHSWLDS